MWGAVLTRYLTMAKYSGFGNVKSAGRVQTPTLALIVEREREREAFVPEIYWTVKGAFRSRGAERPSSRPGTPPSRFKSEAEATRVMDAIAGKTSGTVTAAEKKRRKVAPPTPFNTTALQAAAAAEGITPARTMRIAESLYMDGLISYPRVDNTVYPESLDLRAHPRRAAGGARSTASTPASILTGGPLHPTRGAKETTDHPPIHPTGAADPDKLQARGVEALQPRRAPLHGDAVGRRGRRGHQGHHRRRRRAVRGQGRRPRRRRASARIYPYGLKKDEQLPALAREATRSTSSAPRWRRRQTEPPARYSQGKLIQEMEKRGLGTKATRHAIIERLLEVSTSSTSRSSRRAWAAPSSTRSRRSRRASRRRT